MFDDSDTVPKRQTATGASDDERGRATGVAYNNRVFPVGKFRELEIVFLGRFEISMRVHIVVVDYRS